MTIDMSRQYRQDLRQFVSFQLYSVSNTIPHDLLMLIATYLVENIHKFPRVCLSYCREAKWWYPCVFVKTDDGFYYRKFIGWDVTSILRRHPIKSIPLGEAYLSTYDDNPYPYPFRHYREYDQAWTCTSCNITHARHEWKYSSYAMSFCDNCGEINKLCINEF